MERKNTVLLTVIAVATLLVAVVGATFAYFTATTTNAGTARETNVKTTKLNGATITFESEVDDFKLLDYPGGIGVFGAKATIAKTDGADDTNNYKANFNLKIEYTNKTGTDLEWELYMVEEAQKLTNLDADETTICQLQTKIDGTSTYYWYADKDAEGYTEGNGDPETTGCSAKAITSKLTDGMNATKIASGKLKNTIEEKATITKDTQDETEFDKGSYNENLAERTIDTENTPTKYYYLVVKYPNKNQDQSAKDAGKEISVKLLLDGTPTADLSTES